MKGRLGVGAEEGTDGSVLGEAGGRQVNPLPATNYRPPSPILPPLYNLPDSPLHSLHLPPASPPALPPTRGPVQRLVSLMLQNSAARIFTRRSEKASDGRDGGRSQDSLFVLPKLLDTITIRWNRLCHFGRVLAARWMKTRLRHPLESSGSSDFLANWEASRLLSVGLILKVILGLNSLSGYDTVTGWTTCCVCGRSSLTNAA